MQIILLEHRSGVDDALYAGVVRGNEDLRALTHRFLSESSRALELGGAAPGVPPRVAM